MEKTALDRVHTQFKVWLCGSLHMLSAGRVPLLLVRKIAHRPYALPEDLV